MAEFNFFDVLAINPNFFADADIDARLDKEEVKMAILNRCGTLLPVYTDTRMFKIFSDSFFKQRKEIVKKLVDTLELEYNPIDNYRREEQVDRKYDVKTQNNTETEGTLTTQNSQENMVSAYDSSEYAPRDKTNGNGTNTDKTKAENNGTNDTTEKVKTTVSGNIGITTTQKLIMEERKVAKFDIYKWIAIEFEQNFFICVS